VKRLLLALALLGLVALSAIAGLVAYHWATPFRGYSEPARYVMVAPGSSGREILVELTRQGVIRHPLPGRLYLRWRGDPPLMAGEYRFEGVQTMTEALDKVIRGDVLLHAVTIVEGLTLEETAQHLAESGFGDLERFLDAMADPAPIRDLDEEAENLEGYLFPDTYAFVRGTSEQRMVAAMVENFRRRVQQEIVPLLAADGDRSLRDLVTLASIVEKEARLDSERPLIAGVFHNRLQRGIALYADPTVVFALKQEGRWEGRIRRADLAIDSPYNTYRYAGLPPGPIASPGLASLEAAADPADVPYLYFVSRNDGSHVFSTTLAEHNRNVERWQRQYWRDLRERQRRQAVEDAASSDSAGPSDAR
jgi:UPF0755 protein